MLFYSVSRESRLLAAEWILNSYLNFTFKKCKSAYRCRREVGVVFLVCMFCLTSHCFLKVPVSAMNFLKEKINVCVGKSAFTVEEGYIEDIADISGDTLDF